MVELFVRRTSESNSSCADIIGTNGETLTRISKVSSGGVFGDASFFLSKTYRYTLARFIFTNIIVLVQWCLLTVLFGPWRRVRLPLWSKNTQSFAFCFNMCC